jgi:hypothetical protein
VVTALEFSLFDIATAYAGMMIFDIGRAEEVLRCWAPWAGGRSYLNFTENAVDPRRGYDEQTWRQLAGIRSAVDPNGTFAANHPVPRLFENGHPTS